MPRTQADEFLRDFINDVVSQRCESPFLTVAWVAGEALRALKTSVQRAGALREGAEAVAREVLNADPTRQRVSRLEEFHYVLVEHLTDGELVDLVKSTRDQALERAAASLRHQARLEERRSLPANDDACEACCEEKRVLQ